MKTPNDSVIGAQEFVASVELPDPPPLNINVSKDIFDYDEAKQQAVVVGSDVIAFVKGITPDQRNDIVNASLLAQLVAKKKVAQPSTLTAVKEWYDEYFDVLSRIGFVIQDKGFAEYREASDSFEAHEAILEVAAALLAGTPGALALVKTTLGALQKMSSNSPWITLFNRESRSANTARFQVSLVNEDENGRLLVALIAFGLEARTTLTQVLFFKFHTNDVTLHQHSGKVTINASLLAGVRDQIAGKLVSYASDYIKGLPDL
jgi:hypothetical protein